MVGGTIKVRLSIERILSGGFFCCDARWMEKEGIVVIVTWILKWEGLILGESGRERDGLDRVIREERVRWMRDDKSFVREWRIRADD